MAPPARDSCWQRARVQRAKAALIQILPGSPTTLLMCLAGGAFDVSSHFTAIQTQPAAERSIQPCLSSTPNAALEVPITLLILNSYIYNLYNDRSLASNPQSPCLSIDIGISGRRRHPSVILNPDRYARTLSQRLAAHIRHIATCTIASVASTKRAARHVDLRGPVRVVNSAENRAKDHDKVAASPGPAGRRPSAGRANKLHSGFEFIEVKLIAQVPS